MVPSGLPCTPRSHSCHLLGAHAVPAPSSLHDAEPGCVAPAEPEASSARNNTAVLESHALVCALANDFACSDMKQLTCIWLATQSNPLFSGLAGPSVHAGCSPTVVFCFLLSFILFLFFQPVSPIYCEYGEFSLSSSAHLHLL